MGAPQSKLSLESARHKAIAEHPRAAHPDQDDSEGYVYVDGNSVQDTGCAAKLLRNPEGLSDVLVQDWQSQLLSSPKNRLALTALTANDPKKLLQSRAALIAQKPVFNVKIPFEGTPITNQRSSGRCWLFASTNVFRVALMQKYELESFELSQNYLFFWDKMEKSNYFLEQILDTADLDLDSRVVQTLVAAPVNDGGQWDMVRNLVDKYGLVPQDVYPDSANAMASSTLNQVVCNKLREGALVLRKAAREAARAADRARASAGSEKEKPLPQNLLAALAATKARILREIHAVLTLTLGPPPAADSTVDWSFVDRHGRARRLSITPLDFARDVYSTAGGPLRISRAVIDRQISLVHDPRHPSLSLLTVDRLGNVVGGRGITYVNVSMPQLKAAVIAMLRAGLPVFFGCDVGKFSDSTSGLMDLDLIDYELGLGVSLLGMDKAARLRTGESAMTHAMVLTAVHVEEGNVSVRWRVQNSWGDVPGDKGWFLMTDAWMDEFVYQAVVDPRFLPKEVTDVLQQEPIVLPLWDPMGALA